MSQTEQGLREAIEAIVRRQYELEGDIIGAFIAMIGTHTGASLLDMELVIERRGDGVTAYWVQPKTKATPVKTEVHPEETKELREKLADEKQTRIRYQAILYEICRIADKYAGRINPGTGCTIGTVAADIERQLKEALIVGFDV